MPMRGSLLDCQGCWRKKCRGCTDIDFNPYMIFEMVSTCKILIMIQDEQSNQEYLKDFKILRVIHNKQQKLKLHLAQKTHDLESTICNCTIHSYPWPLIPHRNPQMPSPTVVNTGFLLGHWKRTSNAESTPPIVVTEPIAMLPVSIQNIYPKQLSQPPNCNLSHAPLLPCMHYRHAVVLFGASRNPIWRTITTCRRFHRQLHWHQIDYGNIHGLGDLGQHHCRVAMPLILVGLKHFFGWPHHSDGRNYRSENRPRKLHPLAAVFADHVRSQQTPICPVPV